ncbi:MAG: phage holin family protein [Bacteroidetes bacterium]|nr:phage holin family protein [Bacteroidota bacterium]
MDDNAKLLESLMIKVTDYGKTSFELIKLKALDTATGIISSLIPFSGAFVIIASFMLFVNVGLAFWLGDILGQIYFGFFIVAAFYLVIGSALYFLTKNWLKKLACDFFIKQVLK